MININQNMTPAEVLYQIEHPKYDTHTDFTAFLDAHIFDIEQAVIYILKRMADHE